MKSGLKILQKIQYGFKITDQDEEYTKFSYSISYEKEDLSYKALRDEFETILMNSFELIYGFLMKIMLFIQTKLNEFLIQPLIEVRLLAIRKLLFQVKFYETMTGRFASDQRRIAQSIRKEALELIENFEKEFPDLANNKLKDIKNFFNIGKT